MCVGWDIGLSGVWGAEPQFGVSFLVTYQRQSVPGTFGAGGDEPCLLSQRERSDALGGKVGGTSGKTSRQGGGRAPQRWLGGPAGCWLFVRMSDSLLDISRARFRRTGSSRMPHLRHLNSGPFTLTREVA